MSEPLPTFDVLVAPALAGTRLAPTEEEKPLAALYAYPAPPRPYVRANMVSSVDGGAWGPDHRSGSINDDADWRAFRVQRALADVVVIGGGTARAESYTALEVPKGLEGLRRAGQPLELAVVTRSGRLPDSLVATERPPYVLTGATGAKAAGERLPADRVIVVGRAEDPDDVDLAAALGALADRGLLKVLCEGGPHLLADLLAAELVDELCVTTTPLLLGPGPGRITAGDAPSGSVASAPPRTGRLAHLLHANGTLVARWLLR